MNSFGFRFGCATVVALLGLCAHVHANAIYHNLASGNFSQDWSNTTLITVDDDWSNVPSIIGYLGDEFNSTTAFSSTPPGIQSHVTFDTSRSGNVADVIANQTNPNTNANGGVAEFHLANPVVALQGSGTADAPFLLLHMNSTGRSSVNISYNLRDIDGSTDDTVQQIALQYRLSNSGSFTNVATAYVNDASSGPSLASLVTNVTASLVAWDNQPTLQIRILTGNATGNDEWIGIDDITVTSLPEPSTLALMLAGVLMLKLFVPGRRA